MSHAKLRPLAGLICCLVLASAVALAAAQDEPVDAAAMAVSQAPPAAPQAPLLLEGATVKPAAAASTEGGEPEEPYQKPPRRARAGVLGAAPADAAAQGATAKAVRLSNAASREAVAKILSGEASYADPFSSPAAASYAQPSAADAARPTPQAVCGANSLVTTSYISDCRIILHYYTNRDPTKSKIKSITCSAWRIGDYYMATAGHCVYDVDLKVFATAIDVYCTGANTCNVARTTYATKMSTTPTWINTRASHDGAVIKVANKLPGSSYAIGQASEGGGDARAKAVSAGQTRSITVTGYPSQNTRAGMNCNIAAYAGACKQYSSTGKMSTTLTSKMYTSTEVDICAGHSGGSVWDNALGFMVAINHAELASPCKNYFTPLSNKANANANCERSDGGVSLLCLQGKIP
ncbi:hypothetical protein Rsub_04868 [Raphidocelis subcapitata]|uniref:Peptidase S1 domain-containing protein n=1 Tax=Raphidocelis subcapitata TaxID=307507 RepID=A0A2V0NV28_9CHLO|nr:hypothetical protein Rsub_04868 [Raphidocelis subcapitata]|eukprot:GBF91199.1 hypothetical protein Rsub_04868 [Raphidocelis subcapitata]